MQELTEREQAILAIEAGGSVFFGDKQILRVEDVPTDAEYAAGDPEAEAAALKALENQARLIQQAMEDLKVRTAATKAAASQPKTAEAKTEVKTEQPKTEPVKTEDKK